jgi:hypothetical protein
MIFKQKGPDQKAGTFYSLVPSLVLSKSGSTGMISGQLKTNHPLREKELTDNRTEMMPTTAHPFTISPPLGCNICPVI